MTRSSPLFFSFCTNQFLKSVYLLKLQRVKVCNDLDVALVVSKDLNEGNFRLILLRLDAPAEEHAGDSSPAHAELPEHSERMFENI